MPPWRNAVLQCGRSRGRREARYRAPVLQACAPNCNHAISRHLVAMPRSSRTPPPSSRKPKAGAHRPPLLACMTDDPSNGRQAWPTARTSTSKASSLDGFSSKYQPIQSMTKLETSNDGHGAQARPTGAISSSQLSNACWDWLDTQAT